MPSLSPSLASLRDELQSTSARLHALTDTMDDALWRAKPADNKWSVAECVQHLNMTSRAYIPAIPDALRAGRERGLKSPAGSNRLDIIGRIMIRLLEPPAKRLRVTTTDAFVPQSIEPRSKAVAEYEELQRKLIGFLADADGLALSKIKLASPFNARLRYNVYSTYRVIAAHQRRHLWQAEQARDAVRAAAR
jgi:hypothetical protein